MGRTPISHDSVPYPEGERKARGIALATRSCLAYSVPMTQVTKSKHAELFEKFYEDPAVAAEFLKHNLPQDVAGAIDFSTFISVKETFIAENLRRSLADLVFECNFNDGSDASVYMLMEHKSNPDFTVSLQMLRYMVLIWQRFCENKTSFINLPIVIPMVIYHGQKKWQIKTLRELFDQNTLLLDFVPQFRMIEYNLGKIAEEEIKGDLASTALLLLWKALNSENMYQKLAQLITLLFKVLGPERARKMTIMFFEYIAQSNYKFNRVEFDQEMQKLEEGEAAMKNIAVEWFPEAYKEGMEFGEKKGEKRGEKRGEGVGARRTLLSLLNARFGAVNVSLSGKLEKLQDPNVLSSLAAEVLKVDSQEDFEAIVDKVLSGSQH